MLDHRAQCARVFSRAHWQALVESLMQSFLVSEQTIHDTVQLWALADRKPRSIETLDQIGRDLWSMNLESLRQCSGIAGTATEAEAQEAIDAYSYSPSVTALAQLAKSAGCLRYHCSEGDIGERCFVQLFIALNDLVERVGEPGGYNSAECCGEGAA